MTGSDWVIEPMTVASAAFSLVVAAASAVSEAFVVLSTHGRLKEVVSAIAVRNPK